MAELDIDALVLGAVEIDLGDAVDLQQALAQAFRDLLQLSIVRPVAGHHEQDGIDVGKLVIDERPEHPRRQRGLHIRELPTDEVEQVRHLLRRRRVAEGDLHRGEGGLGIGLHLLEVRQLLQLLLDGVRDLALHFRRGGAGPNHRDVDDLDGKGRILGAPETLIGDEPEQAERHDQEQHQWRMTDRPGRQVETLHGTLPMIRYR